MRFSVAIRKDCRRSGIRCLPSGRPGFKRRHSDAWDGGARQAIKTIRSERLERIVSNRLDSRYREEEREEMTRDVSEVATLVSIIILAFVFVSVAWTCPECMPWHRPDARHILW